MNCKFCNAEVNEEHKFCPFCGKDLTAEEVAEDYGVEETVENVFNVFEETIAEAQPEQKPGKKVWHIVLAIAGAVVALGVLAVVLLSAFGVSLMPRANDIMKKDCYTVEEDKAEKRADTVVATINGKELTNSMLQIYFRMQVLDFANYYGDYASYLGLDFTEPLSEQICYYDDTLTWEQYFLKIALENWQTYQTFGLLAEDAGYTLAEDWQASLDGLPQDLETQAAEGEYESVDAMLREVIGPGCDLETYMEYVSLAYLSSDFYNSEYDRLTPDQEEIETYFTENQSTYEESGITMESGLISSVRHILVFPEGGTTNEETGETTYTEDEWAACYAEAERILNEWKNGEATEESFATLANTYSEDGGSNTNGGLYEEIYYGSGMTENFQDWSIDMTRQTGDTGIVQTEFGYHIMYFVSGEAHWLATAREDLRTERIESMIDGAKESWPMKVTYSKIALSELDL